MDNIRSVNKVGTAQRFERELPLPGREDTKLLLGVLVKNVGVTSEGETARETEIKREGEKQQDA
jgi:hypothetical protein